MVLPLMNFHGNSTGEDDVWNIFKHILPKEWVSYHNYYVDVNQVDVIVLVPDCGVLIIEIKGFYPKNVVTTLDNANILLKNGLIETSPYTQATTYRNKLVTKLIREETGLENRVLAVSCCFPYFNTEQIMEKHLDRICTPELIITGDDLKTTSSFITKVAGIFDKANDAPVYNGSFNYFPSTDLVAMGNIISPQSLGEDYIDMDVVEDVSEENTYSWLVADGREDIEDELINSLHNAWIHGTKIYFFSRDKRAVEKLDGLIRNTISELNLEELIDRKSNLVFNASIEYSNEINRNIEIKNGEKLSLVEAELKELGDIVAFNAEQFIAEHSPMEDMIVKAGAGTGKTFLLVSRIAFICWKKEYSGSDLLSKIILITFTNAATDEMKSRLENYFGKMFLLTFDKKYKEYVECIENMMISTIDSFAKRIINTFSYYLGLGNNAVITSGTIATKRWIHEKVNELLNDEKYKNVDISSYETEKILAHVINKIQNRNINYLNAQALFNNNIAQPEIPEKNDSEYIDKLRNSFIAAALLQVPEVMKSIELENENNNKIMMAAITVYLKRVQEKKEFIETNIVEKPDFLFIDEFQDTDDNQIQLVCDFKNIFNYKIFVVGDPKQSIYRFRGAADDQAFRMLKDKLGVTPLERHLKKNYRTNSQLLEYMDSTFDYLGKNHLLKYEKSDKLIGVISPEVSKEIIALPISNNEEREKVILDTINWFRNNTGVDEKMAILVRRRNQVATIKDMCLDNGIYDVDIDSGGRLYKYESTIDFYKLLIALQNNKSPEYLYNLYTTSYVNRNINKEDVANSKDSVEYFYSHLPESLSKWNEYVNDIHTEPILKVVRTIIDDVEPWRIYGYRFGDTDEIKKIHEHRYRQNLDQLFEKLSIETNGLYLTLNSLISSLEILITTGQEEDEREDKESMRILCRTVHRAKGKEYDYVFLPYSDDHLQSEKSYSAYDFLINENTIGYRFDVNNKNDQIKSDNYEEISLKDNQAQSHEEARILYVAVTRAKKGIIFIQNSSLYGRSKKPVLWQDFLKVGLNEK